MAETLIRGVLWVFLLSSIVGMWYVDTSLHKAILLLVGLGVVQILRAKKGE